MDLYRTISEINGDFNRKSLFRTPCILRPHWRGSPTNWVPALGVKKLEWWGYRAEKEVWRYLQPCGYNTPTWQTDGHRPTAKTALIRIASRGKNCFRWTMHVLTSCHNLSVQQQHESTTEATRRPQTSGQGRWSRKILTTVASFP